MLSTPHHVTRAAVAAEKEVNTSHCTGSHMHQNKIYQWRYLLLKQLILFEEKIIFLVDNPSSLKAYHGVSTCHEGLTSLF